MSLNCKRYFISDFCNHFLTLLVLCLCSVIITPAEAENNTAGTLKPLQLEITTHLGDAQRFLKGDRIHFMISLDKDAYVTLFYQDASDQIVQLLPNPHHPENFFKSGLFIPYPAQNTNFDFTVQPPFGEDRVWAFASDTAVTSFNGHTLENGLARISMSIDQIRSILKQHSKEFYDEARLVINTSEK